MKEIKLYSSILNLYYPIILLCYALTIFKRPLHTGWIAAIMIISIMLLYLRKQHGCVKVSRKSAMVFLYCIWLIGSGIHYIYTGIPFSFYLSAVFQTVIPIVFSIFGQENEDGFLRCFLYSYSIAGVIGLGLLIIRPAWYIEYCASYGYSHIRLSYFVGSITMGCLGTIALMVAMKYLVESRGKKYKALFFIVLVCTFASWQRSAWIVASVVLVVSHYFIYFKWKAIKKSFLFFEIICAEVLLFFSRNFIAEIFTLREELRTKPKTGIFESRIWTWRPGLENTNLLIGTGYGSKGHKALAYGIAGAIGDGSWINLVCEIGLLGVGIFLIIIVFSLIKGKKNLRRLYMPAGIIIVVCLQSIGSNMFESQIIMPLFWYAVGMIISFTREATMISKCKL